MQNYCSQLLAYVHVQPLLAGTVHFVRNLLTFRASRFLQLFDYPGVAINGAGTVFVGAALSNLTPPYQHNWSHLHSTLPIKQAIDGI
jgi:hypothetical protein